jgi:hypothetical protein
VVNASVARHFTARSNGPGTGGGDPAVLRFPCERASVSSIYP